MLFSLIVIGANLLIQVATWPSLCWMADQCYMPLGEAWAAEHLGLLVSVVAWLSAVVCLALLGTFVRFRGRGQVRDYLALNAVSCKSLGGWILAAAAFLAASEWAVYQARHYLVADWSIAVCKTAVVPPLLWSALLLASPVSEELFCRGFMFRGLQASTCGAGGAVLLPAALWAVLHVQYDWYRVAAIFASGILLGTARLQTGSVVPTVVMHSFWNLVSLVEVAVVAP
jgi:membrane protease YdiL (CAAX protease family)